MNSHTILVDVDEITSVPVAVAKAAYEAGRLAGIDEARLQMRQALGLDE